MQTLDERRYRVTRAQIHIFQTVLSALEERPDDDLPEPRWRDHVDTIRGQLHELEANLVYAAGVPRLAPVACQGRP